MWKNLVGKLLKSELWVTVLAMMITPLAKKLGIPDSALSEFILATNGLALAYIGQRGWEKTTVAKRADIAAKPLDVSRIP